jgi:hypothetical protein
MVENTSKAALFSRFDKNFNLNKNITIGLAANGANAERWIP